MKSILLLLYNNIKENWYYQLILIIVSYISLFNHLGSAPIHTWDEGVYASNSLEMILRGDFLVKYYDGAPEMWATQIPLAAWINVLFLMLFGVSEFTIRLPSAISGLIIVFILIKFLHDEFNKQQLGFFASLILLTSNGYISYHVSRTADLDALVTMFSFIYVIYFYRFIKSDLKNKIFLIITLIAIFLAFCTKSVAGLFYLPILFFYLIYSKKLIRFFKIKELYITIIIFLILLITYYWIHEVRTPGYIKTALFREITGRFMGTLDDAHPGIFLMYYNNIKNFNFLPWFFFLPISIFLVFIQKSKELKRFYIYIISLIIFYWLVISVSSTKLNWYDAQLYPLLSILAGLTIYSVYSALLLKFELIKIRKLLFFFLFVVAIYYYPTYNIFRKNISESKAGWSDEKYGPTLKKVKELYPNIKEINILHVGFSPHVTYYKTLFNKFYGYQITTRSIVEKTTFDQNSFILFWHAAVFDVLNKEYNYSIIYQNEEMYLVKVKNRKYIVESLHYNDFENYDLAYFINALNTSFFHSGKNSNIVSKFNEYSIPYLFNGEDLNGNYSTVIVKGWVLYEKHSDGMLVYSIEKEGKTFTWKCLELKDFKPKRKEWFEISQTFEIPKEIPKGYILKIYFWNKSENPLYVDDFSLEFK